MTTPRRRFSPGIDRLEGRLTLSGSGATVILSGSVVEVYGSNHGDTGIVSMKAGAVDVAIANAYGADDVRFPASLVTAIEYFGGTGPNDFTNASGLGGYLHGGSGANRLTGGSAGDYLYATSTATNILIAGSGAETLEAFGAGTNILIGGSGNDAMVTFAGNNTIIGGSGTSFIFADGGRNYIDGGTGVSTVYSFSFADFIVPAPHTTVYRFGY